MPELQQLVVGVVVAAAALHVAWRFGLLPRRSRGVTTVVRVSELKRRAPARTAPTSPAPGATPPPPPRR